MCFEVLSEFSKRGLKPYRFNGQNCLVFRINYLTNVVEGVYLTGNQVRERQDCRYPFYLRFLNQYGGTDDWVFDSQHTLFTGWGEAKTVMGEDLIERVVDRGVFRDGINLQSQELSLNDARVLISLLKSKRAWLFPNGYDAGGEVAVLVKAAQNPDYYTFGEQSNIIDISVQLAQTNVMQTG